MKKLLMVLSFVLGPAFIAFAEVEIVESPIIDYDDPVTISVSSSVYTLVSSSPSAVLRGRSVLLIDNPSTNSDIMHGHISSCASIPTVSTSTIKGPIEIAPSSNGGTISLAEDMCLYLVTRDTAEPENVTVQSVAQKRSR